MIVHPEAAHSTHAQVGLYSQSAGLAPSAGINTIGQPQSRKLTLGEGSTPNAQILVRGVDGSIIAVLHGAQIPHLQKAVAIRGRQDIQSIEVSVPGAAPGMCDLRQAAGWLDITDNLQVDVTVANGQVLCGLANRSSAGSYPDRDGTTVGTTCLYVPGEGGQSGAVQCRADFGQSRQELFQRRS